MNRFPWKLINISVVDEDRYVFYSAFLIGFQENGMVKRKKTAYMIITGIACRWRGQLLKGKETASKNGRSEVQNIAYLTAILDQDAKNNPNKNKIRIISCSLRFRVYNHVINVFQRRVIYTRTYEWKCICSESFCSRLIWFALSLCALRYGH